jgi:hypothetical protein
MICALICCDPGDTSIMASSSVREFAASGKYEIKYISYNWGLNDQGPPGRDYTRAQLFSDNILNRMRSR